MKVISVDKLYDYNFSIEVVNAMKQNVKKYSAFNFIGRPKEKNLLLCLSSCKAKYTFLDGSKHYASEGDIVYIPMNFEYTVRFYDFSDNGSRDIGVNFFLFDKDHLPFILSKRMIVFPACRNACFSLFDKVNRHSEAFIQRPSKMKAAMYDILSVLSEKRRKRVQAKKGFEKISEGISYLEHDDEQRLSIGEIAQLSNVSEIYFRKLFKEYAGVSPTEFRITHKIEKAKFYLDFENMTIEEIAERLGFSSSAYFSRQFKSIVGMTPTQYKARESFTNSDS